MLAAIQARQRAIRQGLAIAMAWVPLTLAAQTYPVSAIPDSLLAGAREVVREESLQFIAKSDREGRILYRKAVTLLNKDSEAGQIQVYYDADTRVRRFEARIYDAAGQLVRKADRSEIKDFAAVDGFSIYRDSRYKLLELSHRQYPYTIEYEYELMAKGMYFINFPHWRIQRYGQSVEQGSLSITLPPGIPLRYQALNVELAPTIEQAPEATTHTWVVRGLKAVSPEPYRPPASEVLPSLLTAAGRFRIGDYEGGMANWADFGAFIGRLYAGRDALPPALAAELHALTADAASNAEKIERLYRYLQRNMRYVSVQLGIGGWQPFDAAYVAQNKYGDCKALSNFMKAMLKEVGIESYPVLIYNGDLRYEVQEDFAISAFNHAILHVPEEDTWLECTSTEYPPGYIGQGNASRNVLLITAQGGRLARTPELKPADNLTSSRTEIVVQADGSAKVKASVHTRNAAHEPYRYAAAVLPQDELERWLVRNSSLPSLRLESLRISASPDQPEARAEYQGSLPGYASRTGKRLFVPLNLVNPAEAPPKKVENRRHPVAIDDNFTHVDTVILHLPEDLQVESLPDGVIEIEEAFGSYRSEVVQAPGQATFIRRFQLRPARLPADQYEGFRRFLAEVHKADRVVAVLVEGQR
jgi:transglutaminase-like putative cysteine protease